MYFETIFCFVVAINKQTNELKDLLIFRDWQIKIGQKMSQNNWHELFRWIEIFYEKENLQTKMRIASKKLQFKNTKSFITVSSFPLGINSRHNLIEFINTLFLQWKGFWNIYNMLKNFSFLNKKKRKPPNPLIVIRIWKPILLHFNFKILCFFFFHFEWMWVGQPNNN